MKPPFRKAAIYFSKSFPIVDRTFFSTAALMMNESAYPKIETYARNMSKFIIITVFLCISNVRKRVLRRIDIMPFKLLFNSWK